MRLALVCLVAAGGSAHAEVKRCATADADLAFMGTDLQEMSGDTGWFPGGYSAQLRITGRVTGKTIVAMGVSPTACWMDRMTATAPGRAGAGMLDSEYGAELKVYGQIHTSVLGYSIDWSGEIPVPFVPTDLLIGANTTFDPALLPGSAQPSISVSDVTSPVRVISTNLLSSIIDITGISGGLDIQVQGEMTTTYATSRLTLGDGTIASFTDRVQIEMPAGGFGTSLAMPIAAAGTVHYAPGLKFNVVFAVRILGISVVSYTLASVEMPLPGIDRAITLSGNAVSLGLPHLDAMPDKVGFVDGATQSLHLHNSGAAALELELASAPPGVSVPPVSIAAGADGVISVTASDPNAAAGVLELATNDPNHPTLRVGLDPTSTTDDTMSGQASSGCNTGGGGSLALIVLLPLIRRHRARR